MYRIQDCNEICDLCSRKNDGNNLRYFQHFLPNPRTVITLCTTCSLKAWIVLTFFHSEERNEIKPTRKYKKGRKGSKTYVKSMQRTKPTDLYCKVCLEETISLKDSGHRDGHFLSDCPDKEYFCEHCKRRYARPQALTFDEMTKVKFARAKHKPQL